MSRCSKDRETKQLFNKQDEQLALAYDVANMRR